MSFHENSVTDSRTIDHNETESCEPTPDTNANPVGVFSQPVIKSGIPDYVFEDFELRERTDRTTGEVIQFLAPQANAVARLATNAVNRIYAGIKALTDEDAALIEGLLADYTNLQQTATGIDDYFANSIGFGLSAEITRSAVKATRWRDIAVGWAGRIKPDDENPDGLNTLMNLVEATNRKVAILFRVHTSLTPGDKKLKFTSAAWSEMQFEAKKKTNQFITKTTEAQNTANETSATIAMLNNL